MWMDILSLFVCQTGVHFIIHASHPRWWGLNFNTLGIDGDCHRFVRDIPIPAVIDAPRTHHDMEQPPNHNLLMVTNGGNDRSMPRSLLVSRRTKKKTRDATVASFPLCFLFLFSALILIGLFRDMGSGRLTLLRDQGIQMVYSNLNNINNIIIHTNTTSTSSATTVAATTITTTTTATTNTHFPVQSYQEGPAHFYCLCASRRDPSCDPTRMCDTILTFKDPTNRQWNIPTSTWTTARNAMYHLAKRRRQRAIMSQHITTTQTTLLVPSHSCFMDGDTKFSFDIPPEIEQQQRKEQPQLSIEMIGKQLLLDQLLHETETDKIIVFNYRKAYYGHLYQFGADANVNCFADESMDQYLPYSTLYDDYAWSLSQRELYSRANTMSPFVFKVYTNVIIWNPKHGEYPRNETAVRQQLLEDRRIMDGWEETCFPPSCKPGTQFACRVVALDPPPTGETTTMANDTSTPPQEEQQESLLGTSVWEFTLNQTHTCGYMALYMG